jgi:hypothetical protein
MRRVFSKACLNWASVVAIVCVSLVLIGGMAQAAHFHASGAPDHDCALCVAAHNVAQAAPQITLDLSSLPVAPLTAGRSLRASRRLVYFRHSIRPPPSGSAPLA